MVVTQVLQVSCSALFFFLVQAKEKIDELQKLTIKPGSKNQNVKSDEENAQTTTCTCMDGMR